VAQPLLGLLGDNAEFFIARRSGGVEVVGFAFLVRSVDLVPTLAAALDVRIPWPITGRTFLRSDYVPDPQVVVYPQGEGPPPPVRMSLEQYERAAAATLAAKQRLFGHGIYAAGPDPDLDGRPAPARAAASALRATIDQSKRLASVDTRSSFVPSNITGRLTGQTRAGLPLAVRAQRPHRRDRLERPAQGRARRGHHVHDPAAAPA